MVRVAARSERIRKYRVLPREFSLEQGELTATMKVRRTPGCQQLVDARHGSLRISASAGGACVTSAEKQFGSRTGFDMRSAAERRKLTGAVSEGAARPARPSNGTRQWPSCYIRTVSRPYKEASRRRPASGSRGSR